MTDMPFHEAASIFPLMTGDEFEELVEDIHKHGLREPVALLDGKILDGRNRYRACLLAGVECRYLESPVNDAIAYVVSMNLKRRHLSVPDRAFVAENIRKYYDDEGKRRMSARRSKGRHKSGCSARRRIEGENNCTRPFKNAKANGSRAMRLALWSVFLAPMLTRPVLCAQGVPDLETAVRAKKLGIRVAAQVAKLPEEQQRAILASDDPRKTFKELTGTAQRPRGEAPPADAPSTAKVAYVRRETKAKRQREALLATGLTRTFYSAALAIIESKRRVLIKAIDENILPINTLANMVKLSAEEIAEKLKVARNKPHRAPMFDLRSTAGQQMRDLLERTLTNWRGFANNIKINSHLFPRTADAIRDIIKDAESTRNAVAEVTVIIEEEGQKCLSKIQG